MDCFKMHDQFIYIIIKRKQQYLKEKTFNMQKIYKWNARNIQMIVNVEDALLCLDLSTLENASLSLWTH